MSFIETSKRFNDLTHELGYDIADFNSHFKNIFGLIENQYAGKGSFVVSGCRVDASNPAASVISPGLLYFDDIDAENNFTGRLVYYPGATVNLSGSNVWYVTYQKGDDRGLFDTYSAVGSSADPGNVPKVQFTDLGETINLTVPSGWTGYAHIIRKGNVRQLTADVRSTSDKGVNDGCGLSLNPIDRPLAYQFYTHALKSDFSMTFALVYYKSDEGLLAFVRPGQITQNGDHYIHTAVWVV